MKNFIIILSILLLSTIQIKAQSSWEIEKQSNVFYIPSAGHAFNEDSIIYINEDGAVVMISGGDNNMEILREPDGIDWNDVDFINDTLGFACAADGFIYKTQNGGKNWVQVGDTANYTADLKGIAVVSEDTIFTAGMSSTLLKSTDGGQTWAKSDFSFGQDLDAGVAFCNGRVGVVAADKKGGYTWYTHNGGDTWQPVNIDFPYSIGTGLNDVTAVGDSTIIAVGWHYCKFKSTDGGKSYTVMGSHTPDYTQHYSVNAITENLFFAGGLNGHIEKTEDGGANWNAIDMPSGEKIIFIEFIDAQNGYAFAGYGQWFVTHDGGGSWTNLLDWPAVNFLGLGFQSNQKIYFIAWGGQVSVTENNGSSFSYPLNVITGSTEHHYSCEFFDADTGIIAGGKGEIYRTTTGGAAWTLLDTSANPMYKNSKTIYSIATHESGLLFAAGASGQIMKSADKGLTWQAVYNSGSRTIESIWIISDEKIIAAAQSGQMYISNTALDSFKLAHDYGAARMKGVEFSGNTGLIVSDKGQIYRTSVSQWDTMEIIFEEPDNIGFNDLEFITDSLIYVVGYNGKIYKSTDAGLNWALEDSVTSVMLREVRYNNKKLWAVGNGGTILSLDIVSAIRPPYIAQTPSNYKLAQNYPNPFNPTTSIEFTIIKNSDVLLEIYNIIGQKVATLINQKMKTGSVKLTWNATGLASGVYFYKLTAGSFTAVKKMTLLK